jgi:hypothetical protein
LVEVGSGGARCLSHVVIDAEAQAVARVLGDSSFEGCAVRPWRLPVRWRGAPETAAELDPVDLAKSALAVTLRLRRAVQAGLPWSVAWDVARHGVKVAEYRRWLRKGRSREALRVWLSGEDLGRSILRERRTPALVTLPPVAVEQSGAQRGVHWYAKWKLAGKLKTCSCGGQDFEVPCRSCVADGSRRGHVEWSAYALPDCYPGLDLPAELTPSPCGEPTCRTSLAGSAAEPKGAQQ